jgi:hypothetical protein
MWQELCKRTTADIFGWVGLQYKLGNLAIAMERLEMPTFSLDDDEDLVADFDRVMVIAKLLLLGIPPEQIPECAPQIPTGYDYYKCQ